MKNTKKTNNKNMALMDKGYEEISFTFTQADTYNYINDTNLNFFGVSSGIKYENLKSNKESRQL